MWRKKRKITYSTIGVAVMFLTLAFSTFTSSSTPSHHLQNTLTQEDKNSVETICQIIIGGKIEQVVGKITQEKLAGITTLAKELSLDFREKMLHSDVRQKIEVLIGELKETGLLPQTKENENITKLFVNRWVNYYQLMRVINNFHNNDKMDDDIKLNYFNFIFGFGKNTSCEKALTGMVMDYVFAFYVYFGWEFLYKIVEFLENRPKILIGLGWWEAQEGGITTLGLKGIKHWGPNANNEIGIALQGFVGLAITTKYVNDNTGFIIGFSYRSFRTKGV